MNITQEQNEFYEIESLAKHFAKDQKLFTEYQLHILATNIFNRYPYKDVSKIVSHLKTTYQTITFKDDVDYVEFLCKQLKAGEISERSCFEEMDSKIAIKEDVDFVKTAIKYKFYLVGNEFIRSVGDRYDKLITDFDNKDLPTFVRLEHYLVLEDEGGVYYETLEPTYIEENKYTFKEFLESVYGKIED